MDREAFVAAFGGIFEDSLWVARCAWDLRPFASCEALHRAMTRQGESAAREEQLALLRAHPNLGTRARMSPYLGAKSRGAVRQTLPRGQTIFHDGVFVDGHRGRFVRPAISNYATSRTNT